jgi:hypothetical protein
MKNLLRNIGYGIASTALALVIALIAFVNGASLVVLNMGDGSAKLWIGVVFAIGTLISIISWFALTVVMREKATVSETIGNFLASFLVLLVTCSVMAGAPGAVFAVMLSFLLSIITMIGLWYSSEEELDESMVSLILERVH